MAILANDSLLKGLRGALGKDIVFRKCKNKTVVAVKGRTRKRNSAWQQEGIDKFKEATAYAREIRKDPVRREQYKKLATALGRHSWYNLIVSEFMRGEITPLLRHVAHRSQTPGRAIVDLRRLKSGSNCPESFGEDCCIFRTQPRKLSGAETYETLAPASFRAHHRGDAQPGRIYAEILHPVGNRRITADCVGDCDRDRHERLPPRKDHPSPLIDVSLRPLHGTDRWRKPFVPVWLVNDELQPAWALPGSAAG